jgi:hypothetical protein
LEIRLGLVARRATPALAEHVARAAVDSTQEAVRAALKHDCAVAWSVHTLRDVIATIREGMAPHVHAAQVAQVLAYLEQAQASHGSRKPVLAAGRDGVFVPIRGDDLYREAATATLSVYDRAGRRLGTVYRVRPVNPFLRPMLRSRHGRKGVYHGQIRIRATQPRAVLAASHRPLEAKWSVRPGVLRGRGPQPDDVLLVA